MSLDRKQLDFPLAIKALSDAGTFEGYGSIYNVVDAYKEVVAPGAFADSLAAYKQAGRMPAMLWQHRQSEPIGVYTEVKEDAIGLFVRGQLALKTARGAEAHELMKMGALTGLSIGFVPRVDSYDRVTGITTLSVVDLYEISPVTFPANDPSRITSVKGLETLTTLAECERYLRDAGGLSRAQATTLVARIKSIGQGEPEHADELLHHLKTLRDTFTTA